ncbi:MAG: hypothetical protein AAB343_00260 [Patescibacteria group bacterium]
MNITDAPFDILNVLKVFGMGAFSFFVGILIAPTLRKILYEMKAWPERSRSKAVTGETATVVSALRKDERRDVPRMGGIIIWGTTLAITLLFWGLAEVTTSPLLEKLNFLSRNQTWLPLFTLVIASSIGLVDDLMFIRSSGTYVAGGISLRKRIVLVALIGLIGGLWFFRQNGIDDILIPFFGEVRLGFWFVPFFILVMLATFSGGIIDGLDGLAGGVLTSAFGAYMGIAFFQTQYDIAAMLSVMVGALLAFLWFNIPPAAFYMGETGILGLTTTLTVVAVLTDAVAVLPIIALPLLATSASAILQIASKKYRGKKLFLAAPLHHHFEALGWTQSQVTMRYWVVSAVVAIIGMVIMLVG